MLYPMGLSTPACTRNWGELLVCLMKTHIELMITNEKNTYFVSSQFSHKCLLRFGCSWQEKRHAAAPPPARVRRRMERNRQKLVGRDKGSLTEQ